MWSGGVSATRATSVADSVLGEAERVTGTSVPSTSFSLFSEMKLGGFVMPIECMICVSIPGGIRRKEEVGWKEKEVNGMSLMFIFRELSFFFDPLSFLEAWIVCVVWELARMRDVREGTVVRTDGTVR